MRHVSSSFIEFIKTLVGLHRTVPSPYSQPILTPGWHFNASQNEGSQYASEVVTTCPNLFLRLGRQGEHVLFGESVLVAGEFHILTICQDNKDFICVLRRLHAPFFIKFHQVSSSFIKTLV